MKNGLKFVVFLITFLLGALYACTEKDEDVIESIPFSSIKVEVDGELVEAQFLDHKNLLLSYENAENFTSAKLRVELNEGYNVIFPTDVDSFDMSNYPVVNFRDPDNRIIKYWFEITSRAFPIIDGSKIGVEGIGFGVVTVQNSTREVIITFDKNKMDLGGIKLFFDEGSLMEGAVVEGDLFFDFSQGVPQELNIRLGEKDRAYKVVLNLSKVMDDPKKYGFADITGNILEGELAEYINLYQATSVVNFPVENNAPETPWSWDVPGHMLDEYMAYVGDWESNRPLKSVSGISFTYATIDISKAAASLVTNPSKRIALNGSEGVVAMSGLSASDATVIYHEGNVINNWTSDGAPWRSTLGFTPEGKISFSNAALYNGRMVKLPFNTDYMGNGYIESGEAWDVTSAVYGKPWIVRDGYLMTRWDMYINDGTGWEIAMGEAWNGVDRSRSFIGLTYDNKIGMAVISHGMSIPQAAWLLNKLGWKDVFFVGGSYWQDNDFQPVLYIDGKLVAGNQGQVSQYCIAIDIKNK